MVKYLNKPAANFIRGLITEVSELTFPENASVDELNCELSRDGSRRRRKGLHLETGSSPSTEDFPRGAVSRVRTWENVGGEPGVEFAVVQVGSKIIFYDKSSSVLSSGRVTTSSSDSSEYSINLVDYERNNSNGAATAPIQVASVKGSLVVASPEINTFYVERNPDTKEFTITEIDFFERDFEWLGETSEYYSAVSTTPANILREYDTKNAGWREDLSDPNSAYDIYTTGEFKYPPLNIAWHSAKNSSDVFDLTLFKTLSNENQTSLIGNGRFIINLYEGNKESVSGINGITDTPETSRFKTIAAFSNRVFFSGLTSKTRSSRIYFSQTLTDINRIGRLHSVNDPTAEFLSDALDTDGGFIDIPEAHNIKLIYNWLTKLLVFADNGVWSIDGVDEVFRPTEFRVKKLFDTGIDTEGSFASIDGNPFWWSFDGIYTIQQDQLGTPAPQDLSRGSIQTFWNNIDGEAKLRVFSEVDSQEKRIFWFYSENGESVNYKYNRALILDVSLGAFYPWKIEDEIGDSRYIIGTSYFRNQGTALTETNVVDNLGNLVVDNSDVQVTALTEAPVVGTSTRIKVLTINSDNKIQWAEFSGIDFHDWGTANYSSFADAGHDSLGDLVTYKTAPYVVVYLGVTETGWEVSGNGYIPVREGSCKVSAFYDFKESSSSVAQQAYRLKTTPIPDPDNLTDFGYPDDIIQTRLKLRGRGRSVKIRFESEEGKDFNIIGWGLVGAANERF
jgi:hypothetical protein